MSGGIFDYAIGPGAANHSEALSIRRPIRVGNVFQYGAGRSSGEGHGGKNGVVIEEREVSGHRYRQKAIVRQVQGAYGGIVGASEGDSVMAADENGLPVRREAVPDDAGEGFAVIEAKPVILGRSGSPALVSGEEGTGCDRDGTKPGGDAS